MDPQAARRARQKTIKEDLSEAYTDEEASPPEWVDLMSQIRAASAELADAIAAETKRFIEDPDIRSALERRERAAASIREKIEAVNVRIHRLNMIAPRARFTRAALDPDELLRPLYRSQRETP